VESNDVRVPLDKRTLLAEWNDNFEILNRLEGVKSNPCFNAFSWQIKRLIEAQIRCRTDLDTIYSELLTIDTI
jgi:hypothetical protein